MSDDIVERLRAVEDWYFKREGPGISLEGEAADEIERLRAELAAEREKRELAERRADQNDEASYYWRKAYSKACLSIEPSPALKKIKGDGDE